MGWVVSGLLDILGRLLAGGDSTIWQLRADVGALLQALFRLSEWSASLAEAEHDAWQNVRGYIRAAGDAVEDMGEDAYYEWGHLLHVILPQSIAWLDGHTHQWVDAKYDPILAADERTLEFHRARLADLEHTQDSYLIPTARRFDGFKEWFDRWPQGVLFTVHDWFMHPHNFAAWATPILARPFVTYVGNPQHRQLRDDLLSTLLGGASDDAERLVAAAVTILSQPVP